MERARAGGYLGRPEPSGLADVVEIILDKGLVIDAYARVSVAGIELLSVDARIVVSSVDTYLRFAEATNRLDLTEQGGRSLVDLAQEGGGAVVEKVATGVVEKKVDSALDRVGDSLGKPVEKAARAAGRKVAEVAEDLASDPPRKKR